MYNGIISLKMKEDRIEQSTGISQNIGINRLKVEDRMK